MRQTGPSLRARDNDYGGKARAKRGLGGRGDRPVRCGGRRCQRPLSDSPHVAPSLFGTRTPSPSTRCQLLSIHSLRPSAP